MKLSSISAYESKGEIILTLWFFNKENGATQARSFMFIVGHSPLDVACILLDIAKNLIHSQ